MSDHYNDAMMALSYAAAAAVRAAIDEDGAPVSALKRIAADIDSLMDHGVTVDEFESARNLYEGAKQAGMV